VSTGAGGMGPGATGAGRGTSSVGAGASGSGVDEIFAALADPTRREVISALAREPSLTASRLAGELPVTRQAVSKHLAALDRAGLVRASRAGRETRYELTPAPLGDAMEWMAGVGARWDASLARLAARARE
jgi:DNA-binding transcriptional ArsR family regulator